MFPMARYVSAALALAVVLAGGVGGAPRQPVSVGDVHFENSGTAAAQAPFLEALAQLHNFEYPTAAALFKQAQQLDPGFAMAFWGEAMTYNHAVWMEQDRDAALQALARLAPTPDARAAKAGTKREQGYMRAVDILYGSGDKETRDLAYATAMADLHRTYPDDVDA